MEYRKAGRSDLELSILGLGCWSLGGGTYWGDSNPEDEKRLLHTAFDLGINYFDTAELYYDGRSEEALGRAIKELPRDRLIIGSKIFPTNAYYQQTLDHCEASLKRIDTDYLDLYMVHWPLNMRSLELATKDENILSNPPQVEDTVAALLKLRDQGKIRNIGVSNFGNYWMQEFERQGIMIAVNQLIYNLFSRAIEFEILPYCEQSDTGVIGYSGLMEGLLTGKYESLDDIPAHYCRTRHYHKDRSPQSRHGGEGCEKEMTEALHKIRKIADDEGIGMAELSIWWATRNKAITCVLAGTRSPERLKENVAGATAVLPDDIYQALDEVSRPVMDALGPYPDAYEHPSLDRTKLKV